MKSIIVFATLLTSNLVLSLHLDSCGVPNDDQINLDGCQETTPHQFPWHVGIFETIIFLHFKQWFLASAAAT